MSSNHTGIVFSGRWLDQLQSNPDRARPPFFDRKGRILLINAVNGVTRERAQSFLTDDHIDRIVKAYEQFKDEPGFNRVATLEEIRAEDGNLSIPLFVPPASANGTECKTQTKDHPEFADSLTNWLKSTQVTRESLPILFEAQGDTS